MKVYAIIASDHYDYRHYYEGFYADPERAWFERTALIIQDQAHYGTIYYRDYNFEIIEVVV